MRIATSTTNGKNTKEAQPKQSFIRYLATTAPLFPEVLTTEASTADAISITEWSDAPFEKNDIKELNKNTAKAAKSNPNTNCTLWFLKKITTLRYESLIDENTPFLLFFLAIERSRFNSQTRRYKKNQKPLPDSSAIFCNFANRKQVYQKKWKKKILYFHETPSNLSP